MKNNSPISEAGTGRVIKIPELKISGMPGADMSRVALQVSYQLDSAGLSIAPVLKERLSRKIAGQVLKSVKEKMKNTGESKP